MEEPNDDRFNYPERWRLYGREVLWIADSGMGECPIHLAYRGGDDGVVYNRHSIRDASYLTYTAPDPWEDVNLSDVEVESNDWGKLRLRTVTDSVYPRGLPPRKFKLVPL